VLARVYPNEIASTNYATVVSSLAFAGTVLGEFLYFIVMPFDQVANYTVGMLIFGVYCIVMHLIRLLNIQYRSSK